MKKLSILHLFTILTSISLSAQQWSLFPTGQRTYWQVGSEVRLYYNDVTVPGGFTDRHYFGADYLTEDEDTPCYDEILEEYYGLENAPVDSIFSTPENWFALTNGDMFPFYQLAEPGFSWGFAVTGTPGFDSLVFTVMSKALETFFDVADSVKTYSLQAFKNTIPQSTFNGVTFRLSRNYGFLEFIPLQKLTEPVLVQAYEILGFDDGQPHSFTSSWEDYFGGFEVGQLLKWKEDAIHSTYYVPPGYERELEIFVDTILSLEFTPDFVKLIISRRVRSERWIDFPVFDTPDEIVNYTEKDTITYSRNQFEPYYTIVPGWFGKTDNFKFSITDYLSIDNNGVIGGEYGGTYVNGDSLECWGQPLAHPGPPIWRLMSNLGITYYFQADGYYTPYYYLKKLLGYTQNGQTFGDVASDVLDTPSPNLDFDIYPNPATQYLHFTLPPEISGQPLRVSIFDLTGKQVRTEELQGVEMKINVADLLPGLYFLTLEGAGIFGREKFVKL